MKKISKTLLIILLSHFKIANGNGCQPHVIFIIDVSWSITELEFKQEIEFAKEYLNIITKSPDINNLTTDELIFYANYTNGYSLEELGNKTKRYWAGKLYTHKTRIYKTIEAALNIFYREDKENIILLLSDVIFNDVSEDENSDERLLGYTNIAASKNILIQIAGFGVGWDVPFAENINYIPSEVALLLTDKENIFYGEKVGDLNAHINNMLTGICWKFTRCGTFPDALIANIANVLDRGDCDNIEIQKRCTPKCKKSFKPLSSVLCNANKQFEINGFVCAPACPEKPSVDHATTESLTQCSENNSECDIVCADGYELNGPQPTCDEERRRWDASETSCGRTNLNFSSLALAFNSIALLSVIAAIAVPELRRILNGRNGLIDEGALLEFDQMFGDADIMDPVIHISA